MLDTDAVNAFAAPGGFVHITRGALALLQDEAELAGVLGHEIIHITEQHTIRAMQKSKSIQMGANETLSGNAALVNQRRRQHLPRSHREGLRSRRRRTRATRRASLLANKVGYAPQGLHRFLTRLQERNKGATEKRGLFASHPETTERLNRLTKQIRRSEAHGVGDAADRYRKNVSYKPVPQSGIAQVAAGTSGLAGGGSGSASTAKPAEAKPEEKKEEPPPQKKSGFGGLGRVHAWRRRRKEVDADDGLCRGARRRSRARRPGRLESQAGPGPRDRG